MPRGSFSMDAVLEEVISPLVARLAQAITKQVADSVATRLEQKLEKTVSVKKLGRARRSRRGEEISKWTADVRARRVPKFVIEATGLDTKKKIVAKFGPDATFAKGKPLPKERAAGGDAEKAEVKAKPPTVRKKGSAAA